MKIKEEYLRPELQVCSFSPVGVIATSDVSPEASFDDLINGGEFNWS